ncbi:prolyl-tRNA synthetase [Candidatus Campbellbacteria bacterium CG11_big_fil_rev_8_21_14_0_20_44_21]|uniref:Proline--tRNA ligase n=1 Tax=Candidatus Campbellbacteria bacterium CG22_combo_CG10-13_8_21_14_all_43_18 TaxID=1974530 RepID=A0A2H0DWY5_9BACT|nr:MAG: prolyl-tRNA synthetase [Candidatus Campbellbacteria bacterium CG22_combo_CG10-13_8_21_14_all_43_18]PIR24134.1 MAG: prolyl-tRNA synthetase [Candidatus Campbellbacteria bacterium CG11_big_fil_rev_8_21_14_0_20_44_21]
MIQSRLFTKTRKEAPKDEVSKNAELLIRGGFISKEMAGVYNYLPLGLRTLNKINKIIREEMDAIGGQEIHMSVLQEKGIWQKSKRWDKTIVDNWFKSKLKNGTEVGLGFTHEEPLANLMKNHISSYRDLPIFPYQIQVKFRNETRAKSGLMRGREFLMKDMYSFCKTEDEQHKFYEKAKKAYGKIFQRLGLGDITYLTFASGGSFSKFSHEFQTITPNGEDTIYIEENKRIALNKEILKEKENIEDFKEKKLVPQKAVEVGNIFNLGTKFSESQGLYYLDEKGKKQKVWMGSYGIGPGRVMGTIVEVFADKSGIVWPEAVAPFKFHIVALDAANKNVRMEAEEIYKKMLGSGIESLYDDREAPAGEKFADSDLIGIPYRIVVSEKNLADGTLEIKNRKTGEVKKVAKEKILNSLLQ